MAYLADTMTEEKLEELENKLKEMYSKAGLNLHRQADKYFKSFARLYQLKEEEVLQGRMTELEFKTWYKNAVGRGERWNTLASDMTKRITTVNQTASAYINNSTPEIFGLNANFTAYEIEKGSGIAFNIYNEDTIRELALNKNHSEFKVLSLNPQRDYKWNYSKIQSALTSGILQGQSIDKIAKSFLGVMENNKYAAIRNARTAVTSAQNAGRQNTFNRAEELGIELEKEWICTYDSRTRESHRMMGGEVVPNKERFSNGLMYPCDTDGAPEEVYNCRCSMRSILPKYSKKRELPSEADYTEWLQEKNNNKSYEEWKSTQPERQEEKNKFVLQRWFVDKKWDEMKKYHLSPVFDYNNKNGIEYYADTENDTVTLVVTNVIGETEKAIHVEIETETVTGRGHKPYSIWIPKTVLIERK